MSPVYLVSSNSEIDLKNKSSHHVSYQHALLSDLVFETCSGTDFRELKPVSSLLNSNDPKTFFCDSHLNSDLPWKLKSTLSPPLSHLTNMTHSFFDSQKSKQDQFSSGLALCFPLQITYSFGQLKVAPYSELDIPLIHLPLQLQQIKHLEYSPMDVKV